LDYPLLFHARAVLESLRGLQVQGLSWSGPVLALRFALPEGARDLVLTLQQNEQGVHIEPPLPVPLQQFRFQDQRHDFTFLPDHLERAVFEGGGPLLGQSLLRLDFERVGNFKAGKRLHVFLECFAGGRLILTDGKLEVIRASRKGGIHVKPGATYLPGQGDLAIPDEELPPEAPILRDWKVSAAEGNRVRGLDSSTLDYLLAMQLSPQSSLDRLLAWPGPWQMAVFSAGAYRPGLLLPNDAEFPEDAHIEEHPDFLPMLGRLGADNRLRRQVDEMRVGLGRYHSAELKRLESLAEAVGEDLSRAEDAELLRRQADTLASHLGEIRRGMDCVVLDDVHNPGNELLIPLNPGDGPKKNLDRFYKRAAKGDRGRANIEKRMAEITKAIRKHRSTLEDLDAPQDGVPLEDLRDALFVDWIEAFPPAREKMVKGKTKPALPFRRFELSGGWWVWVGRNNRENDELSHRASSPNDFWFHAQGVPGSHVVLRKGDHKGEPPASILEATASIAAFYSKAKNSKLVPVVYTLRKYVRKPRGGAPGLAMVEREKSIIVPPKLPES
jgi:hypothetical protein